MYRFAAFAWPPAPDDRSAEIRRHIAAIEAIDPQVWTLAYRAAGLEIWHRGSVSGRMEAHALPGGGVVLGRILSAVEPFPEWNPDHFPPAVQALPPAQVADWFFANSWGSYVGFLPRRPDRAFAVFRDPGGVLPCFRATQGELTVLASNVDDIRAVRGAGFEIDARMLLAEIAMPVVAKARPALKGIDETLPGECTQFEQPIVRDHRWAPLALYHPRAAPVDIEEQARRIRHRLGGIVAALLRPYSTVCHNLGGLDSSILAACIAGSGAAAGLRCVNFFTDTPGGDERHYARRMAAHVGSPLIERRLDWRRVDLDLWATQEFGPSPPPGFDCLTQASDISGLAHSIGADVLTYGTGGDSVFFQVPDILSALDYVAARGSRRRIGRVAIEAAQYGGRSLVSTLSAMLRERWRPRPCFDAIAPLAGMGAITPYLGEAASALDPVSSSNLHPGLVPRDDDPKGKFHHVLSSAFFRSESHRYRFRRDREIDFLCPLIAQPFVETMLAIPTWDLVDGGVNRGLARRAFLPDLPAEIAGRTSKTGLGSIYADLFQHHRPKLRAALLEGILADSAFLDRDRIEIALSRSDDPLSEVDHAMFFDLYAWEIWSRRWVA